MVVSNKWNQANNHLIFEDRLNLQGIELDSFENLQIFMSILKGNILNNKINLNYSEATF